MAGKLQNNDVSLKDLVENIQQNNYLIPKFQRDFVWKKPDIENLGDSIVRGYPISSMLIMPVNGTLKMVATGLRTEGAMPGGPNEQYVLDGQQRLTSIAKLFLKLDNEHEYYFDMLSILVDKFPEDNIIDIPTVKEKLNIKNNGFSAISDSLCRSFNYSKINGPADQRQNFRYISGTAIIESRYSNMINKFLRIFENINEEQTDKYNDYLNACFGAVCSYSVPLTIISADSDLGLVIRVFEKVNSSGKKLTLFDLVNAKSFEVTNENYSMGLADFLSKEIINAINNNILHELAAHVFFEHKNNGNLSPDSLEFNNLARIVRIITINEYTNKKVSPNFNQAEMLNKDGIYWFDSWNKIGREVLGFVSWLGQENLLSIGQLTFFEYMAAIVASYPKLLHEQAFLKEIKRYALYLSITGQPFNKSNADVVSKFIGFAEHIITSHEFSKYKYDNLPHMNIILDEKGVEEIMHGTGQFKAAMYILYNEHQDGLFTKDIMDVSVKSSNTDNMDEHHIYPKARSKHSEEGKIFSSVANFIILNKTTNRHEIKDKSPSAYLREIKNIFGANKFDSILKQNQIEDFINVESAEQAVLAIRKRGVKIAEILCNYFKTTRSLF